MLQKTLQKTKADDNDASSERLTIGRGACKREAAFGLIEVLIVLAVMVILAAIAIPSYDYAVRKARRTEGRTALTSLMQQQERHYTQHSTYVAFSADAGANSPSPSGVSSGGFKWHSAESAAESAYEISARPCEGQSLRECVVLTATPGSALVGIAFRDRECGALSLRSDGRRAASGGGRDCW